MCHDWWMRRQMRREEQFDAELRYLLDEEERKRPGPMPVVEHEPDEELTAAADGYEPGRVRPLS